MYKGKDIRNILRTSDEGVYETSQKEFSNLNYYSNICHVCFNHNRESHTKICTGCKLVSYCCKQHQLEDWPAHKEFCKLISNELKITGTTNIFDAVIKVESSSNGLITLGERRKLVLRFVMEKMKNNFPPSQTEMILFSKHCEICGLTDPSALTACVNCPHANFCHQHNNDSEHQKICFFYTLCSFMDAWQVMVRQNKTEEHNVVTMFDGNLNQFPGKMSEFIKLYCSFKYSDPKSLLYQKFYYSDYLTNSMTLCYILKKFNLSMNSQVEIHLIVENAEEICRDHYWELILHWLPQINNLKLIFFLPDVNFIEFPVKICEKCNKSGKKIILEFCPLMYGVYEESNKPDIVVGFNLDNRFLKDISDAFKILKNVKCPFVITTLNSTEGDKNFKMLNDLFQVVDFNLEKNPFSSTKYCRQFNELQGVAASNMYIIYQKVDKEKVEVIQVPECVIDTVDYDKLLQENMDLKKKAIILLEKKKTMERVLREFKKDCQQEIKQLWTDYQRIENKFKQINVYFDE